MSRWLLVLAFGFFASGVHAEEQPQGFKGESELGNTVTSGNTSTNNLAAKTENKYLAEKDLWTLTGRYLRTTDRSVETALFWDAGLRFDRVITDRFNIYIGYKAEADPYAGYIQRDSADLGAKYSFLQSDDFYWFGEFGYRNSKTRISGRDQHENFLRLYTEMKKTISKTSYAKLWIEHLPNLTEEKAYLTNAEASVSAMLNEMFSLKMSYLAKYKNMPPAGFERLDTIFLTTLVAKY